MSRKRKEQQHPAEPATASEIPDGIIEENTGEETGTAAGTKETDESSVTFTAEQFEEAQKAVASLQKEKDEAVQLAQRTMADFDNFRRRNQAASAESYERGRQDCIKELLTVLDNFDLAMQNTGSDPESWQKGIELVHRQLVEALQKQGLTEVETDGSFDPNLHEAVMQEPAEGVESGKITAVFRKGYRVGNKIIRHSMVKVAE